IASGHTLGVDSVHHSPENRQRRPPPRPSAGGSDFRPTTMLRRSNHLHRRDASELPGGLPGRLSYGAHGASPTCRSPPSARMPSPSPTGEQRVRIVTILWYLLHMRWLPAVSLLACLCTGCPEVRSPTPVP